MADVKPLVCIGFAEALSAPEAVWSLADNGFQVMAFARKGRPSALRRSRYVRIIEVTPPELDFEASLYEINVLLTSLESSSTERVLLPLDDTALWLCNRLKRPEGWVLAGPSEGQAELALDKWKQIQRANKAGLSVPETQLIQTSTDFTSQSSTLPVVLKPAASVIVHDRRLQKGRSWICANQRELDQAHTQWAGKFPLLAQPFIKGAGEGVFGLATKHGVRGWSAHQRLRMMNPHGSGSSACVSQSVSLALKEHVEEFIRESSWRGVFMIELLRDRHGTPWFVELNGRTWGSTALSRRQGLEYPAWAARLALQPDSPVPMTERTEERIICRNIGREFMHLLFVLKGPRSQAFKDWPPFSKALRDVIQISRRDSLYNWRSDDKGVFWSDCWNTIRANVFKARH
jgi:hypothetical protein